MFPRELRFHDESVGRVVADPSSVYTTKWNVYYRYCKYVVLPPLILEGCAARCRFALVPEVGVLRDAIDVS